MAKYPKPPDRRQRRNKASQQLRPVVAAPEPPDGLLKLTREAWAVYWQSEVAQATRDVHFPVVVRLFRLMDERERAYRSVRQNGRVTEGSRGQPTLNPLLRYIALCDAEIRQLEDRLGLSPRGMALLGGHFAHAQRSLDDLDALGHDDGIEEQELDPRVLPISAARREDAVPPNTTEER